MALPASGQISMDDIRVELGVPTQSPFGLDEARDGTYVALNQNSPTLPPSTGAVSLSDWYSYDQSAGDSCTCYTIVNEGGTTGNYTYQNCATNTSLSSNITSGATQVRCVVVGYTPTVNSGTLTITDCETGCSIQGDCSAC